MGKILQNCIADNKEWLYNQYIILGKSIACIAREIDVSKSAIEDRLLKFNIQQRKSWKEKHQELVAKKDKIIELYIVDDITTRQIANLLGFERTAISDLLRFEGILKTAGEKLKGRYIKELASNWRDGKTKLGQLIRSRIENRNWIKSVMKRDNYICQECDKRGGELEVHHITGFSKILSIYKIDTVEKALECEHLWNMDNGLTLCKDCHKKTDSFGYKSRLLDNMATDCVSSLNFA